MSSPSGANIRKAGKTRAVLMRTTATALIAASPLLYSGALAQAVDADSELAAPRVEAGKRTNGAGPASHISALATSGNFRLDAPVLKDGKAFAVTATEAMPGLRLRAPVLEGAAAVRTSGFAGQPVRDLLAVPMNATAGEGRIGASPFSIESLAAGPISEAGAGTDPIDIDNAEAIDAGTGTAIEVDGDQGDVTISNSGDISGANGIIANSGDLNANRDDASFYATTSWKVYDYQSGTYVYDTDGNLVPNPNVWWGGYFKNETNQVTDIFNLDADASDAKVAIDNSGRIAFSGLYGIKATNEAGDSIDITNSGDIVSTEDTFRRVGIYADATADYVKYTGEPVLSQQGEFTYDDQGRLLQGFTPNVYDQTTSIIRMRNDDGSIRIENSGTIDMGAVHRTGPFDNIGYAGSEGITAIGNDGIEIINSGSLKVGDFSVGITAIADGSIDIENSGSLEIGNKSTGIVITDSPLLGYQIGNDYRSSGDNRIVNTGDIVGGLTAEDAAASANAYAFGIGSAVEKYFEKTYAVGIRADVRNTNNEYLARYEQFADEVAYYAGIFGEEYFPSHGFENLRNYTTEIVNQGNIILKDGGRAIVGSAQFGELRVTNSGTISVGDGTGLFDNNVDIMSGGIMLSNFQNDGLGDLYARNEASGIIETGDLGVGMQARNWYGNRATLINDGSITVGSGVVGTDYIFDEGYIAQHPYDRLFKSIGMEGVNRGALNAYVYMRNSGDLTTGDLSLGMRMYANSVDFYVQGRSAGLAFNEGTITTGDNSIGIQASGGSNFVVANTGTITIGDKDVSGYNTNRFTAQSFDLSGYGIFASAGGIGYVFNEGRVATGSGTIGIYNGALQNPNHFNQASITVQGENGIIETGDSAIGMKTHSGYYNRTVNGGTISVGDNSVGIEASAGAHYTQLVDTVQYGGCHRLNYNDGAGCTADTVTTGYSYDYGDFSNVDWDNLVGPTRTEVTQEVSVPGVVVATNSGIVETGDNSVGVRIAGIAGLDYQHYRYVSTPNNDGGRSNQRTRETGTVETDSYVFFDNSGTIRVGANSTAVEITGRGVPRGDGTYAPQMTNYGTILAGAGTAIRANADNSLGSYIQNAGTIVGDILFGDGDDLLLHAQDIDPATGQVLSTGNIVMTDHTIDFGGGENRFEIRRGVISVAAGDDNLITGDNLSVEMTYGEIDARDAFIAMPAMMGMTTLAAAPLAAGTNFSTLTIDGNVSGTFRFAADVGASGVSDALTITGNVASGSDIGFILNPVEQLKGAVEIRPLNIGGTNDASVIDVAGVTGLYADSLVSSATRFDAASGDVVIDAVFGLGHMGTAANSAAVSAQNWLAASLGSYGDRNIRAYTGRNGEGLSAWGYAFQDEGEIRPGSDLQDLSFRQIAQGVQAGVQWSRDLAGGRFSVSPMFTYGTAETNLNANSSSSRSHPWALGFNASYAADAGFYVDATYQRMEMDVDLKTPGTASQATGSTKIDGQGFNLEAGYAHTLSSGLTVEPQVQFTHVDLDLDDFASSDGIYGLTDIGGKATTVRAGVGIYKVFETRSGSITPMASLSYLNAVDGETALASNGVAFASDTSGSGYKAEIGVLGRHGSWDFAGKLALSESSTTGSIFSPSLSLSYRFGANAADAAPANATLSLPEVDEGSRLAIRVPAESPAPEAAVADQAQNGLQRASLTTGYAPAVAQPALVTASFAQDAVQPLEDAAAEPTGEPAAEDDGEIVVTGTLVQRSAPADIAPVTVITSDEMAEKGLVTLGDVMKSFTQNDGFTQGKASNLLGRFTFGAEEVNFRGLGAGRTLVLVNGRRIADYPLPFGGEQNGADLGTIPMSAIANVQFLSSGASATYGSDAVGGVVNIITKRDMEQTSAELTGGMYQQGFGETMRASLVTGNSFARGSYTIGVEGFYSGEILASDAKWFRKNAPFDAQMVSIMRAAGSNIESVVSENACSTLGFTYEGGNCNSVVTDTISLNPKVKQASAFFDGRYDLTDRIELFGTAMASIARYDTRSNVLFWEGVIGDERGGATFVTRAFSEDELGVTDVGVDNNMWTAVFGAKGGFDVGSDVWYWDLSYSHGRYSTDQTTISLKEEGAKNWILDGAGSVTDFDGQRYTYIVDNDFYDSRLIDNIVRPVQAGDVSDLIGENVTKARSSSQTLSATLNGSLGNLGFLFKPAKFALRAEYAHQTTAIDPDERTLNTTGQGWFNIGAVQARGERDRWALAGEIDATVFSNLDIMLAARYDHYDDASSIKGRVTGQAKFLYRPTDWLKIRGGYGQTFRAPDMFNIYGRSDGFEYVPDLSAPGCYDGTSYVCGFTQVASTRQADPSLREEHGDDLGLGIIFNPITNFTLTADWYRIKLKDLVITESAFDLVQKEWQCNTGVLDSNSLLCADIYDRVVRNDFDAIERVIVQPINQSSLTRQGIDIRANYSFESAKLGQFNFGLNYSKVLKFNLTRFAGDEPLDLEYGEPGASQPANGLGASLSWYQPLTTGKAISAGLFLQRTGRVKNYDHSQFMGPFYDVNLTVGYQMDTKTQLRFTVNNLLGAKPEDNGSGFWPGFWQHLQLDKAMGRSFYLSVGHSFN